MQSEKVTSSHDRPLRVCLLTYRGNPRCGGQGVYVKRLSRALTDIGHKVEVLSGPPYPELDPDIILHKLPSLNLYDPEDLFRVPSLQELRCPINRREWFSVSTGGFPEPHTFGIRAYNFLKENLERYDVIHDNQCLAPGLLNIRKLGLPVVATIHHPITVDRQTDIDAKKWPWQKLKVRRWYSFLGKQIRVSRQIEHLITVSAASRTDISQAFAIPEDKFRIAGNGVNLEIFHPLPEVRRATNRIMVTNSADTPLKGMRYFIEAIHAIRQEREIEVTVIGKPKPDGLIDKMVKKLELQDIINFTGRIDDSEFARYYAEATMAVVPSVYEGFGMPASEAMACGVPVISTTGGALPEVVGDAGILIPPADSGAIRDAIIDLLDHPEKREALGRAGYERAIAKFTWEETARRVTAVYNEALDDNL